MNYRVGDNLAHAPLRQLVYVSPYESTEVGTNVHLLEHILVGTLDLGHHVASDVTPVEERRARVPLEDGALQGLNHLGAAREYQEGICWEGFAVLLLQDAPGTEPRRTTRLRRTGSTGRISPDGSSRKRLPTSSRDSGRSPQVGSTTGSTGSTCLPSCRWTYREPSPFGSGDSISITTERRAST
jgi:hypothetical protein